MTGILAGKEWFLKYFSHFLKNTIRYSQGYSGVWWLFFKDAHFEISQSWRASYFGEKHVFCWFCVFFHFFHKLSSQGYEHLDSREILLTTKNSMFWAFSNYRIQDRLFCFQKILKRLIIWGNTIQFPKSGRTYNIPKIYFSHKKHSFQVCFHKADTTFGRHMIEICWWCRWRRTCPRLNKNEIARWKLRNTNRLPKL